MTVKIPQKDDLRGHLKAYVSLQRGSMQFVSSCNNRLHCQATETMTAVNSAACIENTAAMWRERPQGGPKYGHHYFVRLHFKKY